MVRVLSGKPLKYTVTLHLPDGSRVEFQSNTTPKVKFHDEARCLWLCAGDYSADPVMEWVPGAIILTEENPK